MSKKNKENITIVEVERTRSLTLVELCQALHTGPDLIIEMVEYQLLIPSGETQEEWSFDEINFKRAKTAASFYHDLEVNMPGIGLALDLMDKIEALEKELTTLQKLLK